MISALSRCLASCRLSGVGVDGKSDRHISPSTRLVWMMHTDGGGERGDCWLRRAEDRDYMAWPHNIIQFGTSYYRFHAPPL